MDRHAAFPRPIAHRGLHDVGNGIAENSASAFERAIEGGFGIECDLQLSADGDAMVIHDEILDRVAARPGLVREMKGSELARIALAGSSSNDRILHFSELLALVDGRTPLAVELKPQRGGRNAALADFAARTSKAYRGPLAFISFDPDLLVLMRRFGSKAPLGIIVERFTSEAAMEYLSASKRFAMRHLLHWPLTRFDFIASDQHALTLPFVRLFRALGYPVLTWTIISANQSAAARRHSDQIAFEGFQPEAA